MTHNWPSYYYTVPTVSFAILYNIPKFFELKTETRYYHQTYNETEEKNGTDLQTVTETYEVIILYTEIMFQGTIFISFCHLLRILKLFVFLVFNCCWDLPAEESSLLPGLRDVS